MFDWVLNTTLPYLHFHVSSSSVQNKKTLDISFAYQTIIAKSWIILNAEISITAVTFSHWSKIFLPGVHFVMKVSKKTMGKIQWQNTFPGIFVVTFEHNSQLFLVFILLILNRKMVAWLQMCFFWKIKALKTDIFFVIKEIKISP